MPPNASIPAVDFWRLCVPVVLLLSLTAGRTRECPPAQRFGDSFEHFVAMRFLLVSVSILAVLFLFIFPVLLLVITRARRRAGINRVGCGVILGVLLSLWFSAVLAMGLQSDDGLSQRTEQRKQTESKRTDTRPKQQLRASADEQKQDTAKEPECSHEGQSNYYDCLIRLRTARATAEHAYWAKVGAWVSGFALFFAVIAAAVALGTMWIIRAVAERALRAHVLVHPGNLEFNGRVPVVLHFRIKNTGHTPAYKVISFERFHFLPFPLPESYGIGEPDDGTTAETTNVMAAQESRAAVRPVGRPMTTAMEAQLRADNHRWYMFARVRYRDVFSRRVRVTNLCVSLPGTQLMAFLDAGSEGTMKCKWDYEERHNDAD